MDIRCTLKSMYNRFVGYKYGFELIIFIKLLIVVFKGVK